MCRAAALRWSSSHHNHPGRVQQRRQYACCCPAEPARVGDAASAPFNIRFRPAKVEDAARCAEIDAQCLTLGSGGWSESLFTTTATSTLSKCIVAEVRHAQSSQGSMEQEVVAFACMRVVAGEAQLENIAVLPTMHGQGIGRQLLQHILQECGCVEAQGVPCYLEVKDGNTAAIKLYELLGFKAVGRRKHYYPDGSDAVLMNRDPGPLIKVPRLRQW